VDHARQQYPRLALFVLANIEIAWRADGQHQASGGVAHIVEPWAIDSGELAPVGYRYTVPRLTV
jgi:hypothetical protein